MAIRLSNKAANGFLALGRMKAGKMNNTEKAYDRHLALRLQAGEIIWYCFEGIKFRLADKTFYTPDFPVLTASGLMEIHEVKGYWTDDARVKIKVAAEMYPFRFLAVKKRTRKQGRGWDIETFE